MKSIEIILMMTQLSIVIGFLRLTSAVERIELKLKNKSVTERHE